MLLVRDILQIDPARMKEVRELAEKNLGLLRKFDLPVTRLLTDLVGDYYTLVIESEVPDLGTYEKGLRGGFADPEWQAFYGKIRATVRGGRREIFTILG
jgi:hypothetical protein